MDCPLATWLKSSIKDKIQWSRIIEKCSHIAALMKSRRGIAVIEGYYSLRKGTESPVKLNSAETCTKNAVFNAFPLNFCKEA